MSLKLKTNKCTLPVFSSLQHDKEDYQPFMTSKSAVFGAPNFF